MPGGLRYGRQGDVSADESALGRASKARLYRPTVAAGRYVAPLCCHSTEILSQTCVLAGRDDSGRNTS